MLLLLLNAAIDCIQGWVQELFKTRAIGGFICYWIVNQVFPNANNQKKRNFQFPSFRPYVLIYASQVKIFFACNGRKIQVTA